jgi:hypothetical protein
VPARDNLFKAPTAKIIKIKQEKMKIIKISKSKGIVGRLVVELAGVGGGNEEKVQFGFTLSTCIF